MINRPKNSKTLLVLIAILLLANIAGLVFFWVNKPGHEKISGAEERKNAMVGYLKNDIGFSTRQLQAYDTLSAQHRRDMGVLFDLLRKEKEKRLSYIARFGFADTAIATAVGNTAAKQQMLETKMLMHLKDVRKICSEQQKIKFDTSIYKLFVKKNGGGNKKPD
jgi:hypothetical protein